MPNSTASLKKIINISNDLNEDLFDNNYKWTSISGEPSYLVGREALTIAENQKYLLRHPIKYGYLNNEYGFQASIDDLTKIIEWCMIQVMQINKNEFQNYGVVLIIPDMFIRYQVKALINIFLKVLSFKSIFVHLESVLATFGSALQTSCVVDIGADKVNVCCIDEGLIFDESILRKNFGGNDLTKLMYLMMTRKSAINYFPSIYFDIGNPYHFRIFEKLKENECEFMSLQNPSTLLMPKNIKIWLHRKNNTTKVFNVTITDPIYFTPLGLFYKSIFESIKKYSLPNVDYYNDLYEETYVDPEDYMVDLIHNLIAVQNETKKEELVKKDNSSIIKLPANDMDDSMSISRSDENSSQIYEEQQHCKKNSYENMFQLANLEDMICQSIMSVNNPEMRKKLANCIVLVGGGSKFKGIVDFIEDRLIDKLTTLDQEIDRVEIIQLPGVDMKTIHWIGGTIIPKLDSSKDMWISRERWMGEFEKIEDNKEQKEKDLKDNVSVAEATETAKDKTKKKDRHLDGGVKILREKSAFAW